MRNFFVAFGALVNAGLFLQCTSIPDCPNCTLYAEEAGSDVVPPPVGCDINVEPKDAPLCVDESYAVFVDSNNGDDTASGTKAFPVKTITHAVTLLGNKPRIYICGAGILNEHVELMSAISLYGGFDCTSWEYNGKKATVQSDTSAPALKLTRLPGPITVSDLGFEAQPGSPEALSSIAVFTLNSTVTFTRTELVAHVAAGGGSGQDGKTGSQTVTSVGNMNAAQKTAGPGMICTCSTGGSTTTATGGNGGSANSNGQPGTSVPSVPNPTAPDDGAGGSGGTRDCNNSGNGHNGAAAPVGAKGDAVTTLGTLAPAGWLPSDGNAGKDGGPGQGGGGGGSNDGGPGGGGGCGGCGGTGGGGGQAGGSSVALLSYQSTVTLNSCQLLTDQAGDGGQGGTSGNNTDGASGGNGYNSGGGTTSPGCSGGKGGAGGAGGGGSGGAGGISAGILYAGGQPTVDSGSTLTSTAADAAAGGIGGVPGQAPEGNDGPSGVVGKLVSADNGTVAVIE